MQYTIIQPFSFVNVVSAAYFNTECDMMTVLSHKVMKQLVLKTSGKQHTNTNILRQDGGKLWFADLVDSSADKMFWRHWAKIVFRDQV